MSDIKWCHSLNGEDFSSGTFSTKEEAIVDAEANYCDGYTTGFYVAKCNLYQPYVDAENVINQIQEDAYDKCGEYAEEYLNTALSALKDAEYKILEERLNVVFKQWAKETKNEPSFYTVDINSIEKIKVSEKEVKSDDFIDDLIDVASSAFESKDRELLEAAIRRSKLYLAYNHAVYERDCARERSKLDWGDRNA